MKHTRLFPLLSLLGVICLFLSACSVQNSLPSENTEPSMESTQTVNSADEQAIGSLQTDAEDKTNQGKQDTEETTNESLEKNHAEPDAQEDGKPMAENEITITSKGTTFTAKLADNSSAEALKRLLAEGPLTIEMDDYGNFEKVGSIGHTLPQNNEQITTQPGDIILYGGNSITIYYGTNSWNFTRLGKIENVSREDILSAFGKGKVSVTFSLQKP